ncbi:MAG TPA: sigma-70 family RNA polymerase sigma factor [Gammaproteobacteria bacterium]|nr:sigma-70 family RNA polymerase sigma factor [Gammaproteobacteria bacterium]
MVPDSSDPTLEAQVSADLVRRIGENDRGAEHEMHQRYHRALHFIVSRKTSDKELVEDICQRAFMVAIEKLRASALRKPESLAGFLRSTALNLLIADQRKQFRQSTTADSEAVELAADRAPGPFDEVSGEQLRNLVRALLEELSQPRDREILIRFYLDEEDKPSICRSLELDSEHFNRVLFRARQRFRELLEEANRKGKLRLVG